MNIEIEWGGLPERYQYELQMLIREFYPFITFHNGDGGMRLMVSEDAISFYYGDYSDHRMLCQEKRYQGDVLKNRLKATVYDILSRYTGMAVPWGILTGVRPTKIAYAYLEEGLCEDELTQRLKTAYRVREDKARLMIGTARRERELLQDHQGTDVSLYIGIPFCPSRCAYCSFVSYDYHQYEELMEDYVQALIQEMEQTAELFGNRRKRSLYMGGGTPTILSPVQMERILRTVDRLFSLDRFQEITIEGGRPDTITREKLEVMRAYGVQRLSINPQTMNQATLDMVGRRHSVEQIYEAFHLARSMGFDNINMDFILGLPGETIHEVRESMSKVRELSPDSLTIHTLAIKRSSRFYQEGTGAELSKQEPGVIDEMIQETARTAFKMGLQAYYMYRQKNMAGNFENVGYSKPGKECIYNIEIMEERQSIIAYGAGAVSKVYYPEQNRLERVPNVKNVTEYIQRIQEMVVRKRKGWPND